MLKLRWPTAFRPEQAIHGQVELSFSPIPYASGHADPPQRPRDPQIGDSLEYNVCHCRTETVVPHAEGLPTNREPSQHDG